MAALQPRAPRVLFFPAHVFTVGWLLNRYQWGYDIIYLHVGLANAAAVALYEGAGYAPVTEGRRLDGPGVPFFENTFVIADPDELTYMFRAL